MHYLISQDVLNTLQEAARTPTAPTATERAAYIMQASVSRKGMVIADGAARIVVDGVLTPKPDLLAVLFGGGNTTYESLQADLAAAAADPSVSRVLLDISSPGGTVDGLFPTLEAIQSFPKPITARASMATSAAYAIAAATNRITAAGPFASFGSIGVAASFFTSDRIVDIANRESPNKRPDVRTEQGRAVVQNYLDDIFGLFVGAIAKGRKASVETVRDNYGRGAVLLATEARERGMIDRVGSYGEGDPDSNVATVERLASKLAAVCGGTIARRPGETDEEFSARVLNEDDDAGMPRLTKPRLLDLFASDLDERNRPQQPQHAPAAKPMSSDDLQDLFASDLAGE